MQMADEKTERTGYLTALKKRTDKDAGLAKLSQILQLGVFQLEYYDSTDQDLEGLWHWQWDSAGEIGDALGIHEQALFTSAPNALPKRELPSDVTKGAEDWHSVDAQIRWLRQRIVEMREED
jgi:hypothetical protein